MPFHRLTLIQSGQAHMNVNTSSTELLDTNTFMTKFNFDTIEEAVAGADDLNFGTFPITDPLSAIEGELQFLSKGGIRIQRFLAGANNEWIYSECSECTATNRSTYQETSKPINCKTCDHDYPLKEML